MLLQRPVPVGRRLHPLPIRIMHWVNAVVKVLIMITSGWGIYDDDVIIRVDPISVSSGGWETGRRGASTGTSPACGSSPSTG